MSPREPVERVQAALKAEPRIEPELRRTILRWSLVAALLGGTGVTASKTGALALVLPTAGAAPVDEWRAKMEKSSQQTKRLVRWLVLQEVRRQEREGRNIDPPPDFEADTP